MFGVGSEISAQIMESEGTKNYLLFYYFIYFYFYLFLSILIITIDYFF